MANYLDQDVERAAQHDPRNQHIQRTGTDNSASTGAQSNDSGGRQDDSTGTLVGSGPRISTILHERHINMIALSATIGSGLFKNTGEIIKLAGPGGAILAYLFMGLVYLSVVSCLGEMTALMPVRGPIIEFPCRFLDKRVAFAVGWMYWLTYAITVPAQIVAASSLMEFHYVQPHDPEYVWNFGVVLALWILAFFAIICLVNFLPVGIFGEIEWVIGSLKILVIIALILLTFIIPSGVSWSDPYPGFFSNNGTIVNGHPYEGATGRFFSVWSAMNKALFSYIGMEIIAVAAAETRVEEALNAGVEQEVFKIATRKIYIRIIALYCCSIFAVSFCVPSTDSRLWTFGRPGKAGAESSPFIIAIIDAGIPTLPHILNAFFVLSATSAGVIALYVASRTLHVLAMQGFTPTWAMTRKLTRLTNQSPRPFNAVLFSIPLGLLAFLACKSTPKKVFDALVTISVVSCLIVMAVVCLTYICFSKKLAQMKENPPMHLGNPPDAYDRESRGYPYKSRIQPYKAWAALIICSVMIIMNGFRVFLGNAFNGGDFVASYISLLLFLLLFVGYNLRTRGMWRWSTVLEDVPSTFRCCKHSAERRGTLNYAGKPFWGQVKAFLRWLWVWCK